MPVIIAVVSGCPLTEMPRNKLRYSLMNCRFVIPMLAIPLAAAQPAPVPRTQEQVTRDIRANYTKYEYRIPARDGVKLFTSVYIPKDVFSDHKTYPIMMVRTPYSVAPYGPDIYRGNLGPSEFFEKEKFIFAYQDVRGRYMSEGEHITIRPQSPAHGSAKEVDESTDAFDSIGWLVKHVPGNAGKAGIWGISQPGFYATAAMIDAHPALVASSPQAPVTDYYLGDDDYHNGAYMLAANFGFYMGFRPREGEPAKPAPAVRFDFGTPDGYDFYLNMGSLANADEKYFQHKNPYWTDHITHTAYDGYWASRSIWKYLKNIKPAVLLVGGWYDTEDPQGAIRQYDFMEAHAPPQQTLVLGPWNHGGFARGDGERLGNINFGSKTGLYYRENIEFPFFLYHLKGKGKGDFPKAWLFQTGVNEWRRFASWPPHEAKPAELFPDAGGRLSWQRPASGGVDEYVSDPNKPVPHVGFVTQGMVNTYMVEDQRFAASRTDVLVYKTDVLERDVTITGPITVDLKVSTSGTDSDFVVKVIDVYAGDYPADLNGPVPSAVPGSVVPMGGYQQLVRGEPFRGKYRKGFEKGVPFEPGKPERIVFDLPDTAHTFRAGHRIMVQVQSSWFPLTDRNPQKFVDIPNAKPADFVKATQRVYRGGADGTRLVFRVAE